MKDIKWFFLFIFGFILTSIGLTAFYGWIATSSCTDVCNYTCGSSCYVDCYEFCSRRRNYSSLVSGIIFVILGSILIFITGLILTRKLYIRESKDSNSNSNLNSNSNSTKSKSKPKFKEIFKKLFFHKQINDQEKMESELNEVVEVTNDDTTIADVTTTTTTTTTNTVESGNLREQLIAQSAQIKALNERLEQIELLPRETSAQEVIELVESQTLENNENKNNINNNDDNNNKNDNNNDNNNG